MRHGALRRGRFATGSRRLRAWAGAILPAVAVWVVYCLAVAWGQRGLGHRWLVDADCYQRLQRVNAIAVDGQYPLRALAFVNPPAGETQLYSLPMDLVLMAGAWPGYLCTGRWADSLYFAGYWVAPMIFIATLALLGAAAARLAGHGAAMLSSLVAVATAPITGWYLPGRPDHHALIHLCFVALVGWAVRDGWRPGTEVRRGGWGAAAAAACVCAAGLWVSIETVPIAFAVWAWFGGSYVMAAPEAARGAWRRWLGFSALLGWALVCAYLVEHGLDGTMAWASDSLSARWILPVAGGLAGAGLAGLGAGHGSVARRTCVVVAALGGLASACWMNPGWGDPARAPGYDFAWRLMAGFTSDMRGLWSHEQPLPLMAFYWWGGAFLPAVFLAPIWTAGGGRFRLIRLWLCGLMVGFAALSLLHLRWAQYAATLGALVFACAAGPALARRWRSAALRRSEPSKRVASRLRVRFLILGIILTLCPRLAWLALARPPAWQIEPAAAEPHLDALRDAWEEDRRRQGIAARGVLTHMMLGPAVAYRWDAAVLATPYPRNAAGIQRAFDLFFSSDPPGSANAARHLGYPYALVLTATDIPEVQDYCRLRDNRPALSGSLLESLGGRSPPGIVVAERQVCQEPPVSIRLIRLNRL